MPTRFGRRPTEKSALASYTSDHYDATSTTGASDHRHHRAIASSPSEGTPESETSADALVDEALTSIGVGRFHYGMFALSGLGWFSNNFWLQGLSVIAPKVQATFGIADTHIGIYSTSLSAGLLFGAMFWGLVASRVGRKVPFQLSVVIATVVAVLALFAPSFPLLVLAVFPLGFCTASVIPVDGAFLAEFLPSGQRRMLTLLALFFAIGDVSAFVLALGILPRFVCAGEAAGCSLADRNGWRVLLLVMSGVQLGIMVLRVFFLGVRESPVFLVSRGRYEEAALTIEEMARRCGRPAPAGPISALRSLGEVATPASTLTLGEEKRPSVLSMLCATRQKVASLLLIVLYASCLAFGYFTFLFYLPGYLDKRTRGAGGTGEVVTAEQGYIDLILYASCGLPASFAGMFLADTRLGRKGTLALTLWMSGSMMTLFPQTGTHMTSLLAMCALNFSISIVYAVTGSYVAEVFGAEERATAGGISSSMQRVAGMMAPLVTGMVVGSGETVPFYVGASVLVLGGIFAILLPVETRPRRGRTPKGEEVETTT